MNTLIASQVGSNQFKTKRQFTHKGKAIIAGTLISFFLLASATIAINQFFSTHSLVFQPLFSLHFQSPVKVVARVSPLPEIIKVNSATPLTPIQTYICEKFGADCKTALAVAKAENGTWQCDRFGINTNGTIDVGLFQINSIHLKKGITLGELVDCEKNVDIAYSLFKAQGWTPWVAWKNGAYLKFMY